MLCVVFFGVGRELERGRTAPLSIATKTTLAFVLFGFAAVGLSSAVMVRRSRAAFEAAVVERHQSLVTSRAIALREHLDLAQEELLHVARLLGPSGGAVRAVIESDAPLGPSERQVLHQAFEQTPFFNVVVQLFDVEGRCRASEPSNAPCEGRSFATSPWFRAASVERRASLVFDRTPEGRPLVELVAPIHEPSGDVLAWLRGEVDLDQDRLLMTAVREALPPETSIALVDGRAEVIRTEPSDAALTPRLASEVLRTRHGASLEDDAGGRVLSVWAPIGVGDAYLVFSWPWEVLDDAIERQTTGLLTVFAVALLFAVLAGLLFARFLIVPIRRLADDVRRARATRTLPVGTGGDELAELRRVFAELFASQAKREEELAAGVAERTSELERTRDALVQAERLATVGRAGAVLSHELRNSLNAISVGIDALRADLGSPSRESVRRELRGEIARLLALSDALLGLARPTEPRRRPIESTGLFDRLALLVQDFADERRVALEVRRLASPPSLVLDPDLVQSALVNLVRNAVEAASDAGREGGHVEVRESLEENRWVVEVDDDGAGIPEEQRPRLFHPFATGRAKGVGLGLPVAQRFVQLHGGTLDLVPGRLGGACFRLAIPAVEIASATEVSS